MSKRKPAKIAPKRVSRPKAPKPDPRFAGSGETKLTVPAPKTRVGRSPLLAEVDRLLAEDRRTEATKVFERILFYGTPDEFSPPQPPSRWSRLWAWLGRLGRP